MARGSLATYQKKRDFEKTSEPKGKIAEGETFRFVVHEHHASRLHFDLRLEMAGVLKSFAVPKGPSMDPGDKRLAVQTEDHPIQYLDYEGTISEGQYGGGEMVIWDQGIYEPLAEKGKPFDPVKGVEQDGKLHFILAGKKLRGEFILVKGAFGGGKGPENRNWLLFKKNDADAEPGWELAQLLPYGSRFQKPKDAEVAAENLPRAPAKFAPKDGKPAAAPKAGSRLAAEQPKQARPQPLKISKWPAKARKAPLPDFVEPMAAKLADRPFTDPDWVFESKWDGWRALLRVDGDAQHLISRNRKSLDDMFPELRGLHAALRSRSCILDGEVVALDDNGVPNFSLLQSRLKGKRGSAAGGDMVYYAFDLIHCDGMDLTGCTLLERKAILKKVIAPSDDLRYSDHFEERGEEIFEKARAIGLEGVIAKLKESPYRSTRSPEWLKFKSRLRQEVAVVGYTQPRASRQHLGALVAGINVNGVLTYCGHVGGGFNQKSLKETYDLLQKYKTEYPAFRDPPPKTNEPVQWLAPKLVAEVEFAEWTSDGLMRQPVFMGMRPDKDPKQCIREQPLPATELRDEAEAGEGVEDDPPPPAPKGAKGAKTAKTAKKAPAKTASPKIAAPKGKPGKDQPAFTNLDKVYWPAERYTKGDLIEYYRAVMPWMFPHIKDRPMILKRYPNGINAPYFYQHNLETAPPFVRTIEEPEEDGSIVNYAVAENPETVLYLANLGTIAMNPWLSRVQTLDSPDWIVLDLDPQNVEFPVVCEMAWYLKGLLDKLGVHAFAKTSGSKGMHVYVPLKPGYSYSEGLAFAQVIGTYAAQEKPDHFTVERYLKTRSKDLIYLDCLQNIRGKSVAAVYSVRERAGATVSTPLEWSEVKKKVKTEDFTMKNILKRIEKKGDLFKDALTKRNSIPEALKRMEKLLG